MTMLTSKLGVSVGNLLGLNEGTNVEISVGIKLGLVVEGPLEVGPTESTNTGSTETVTRQYHKSTQIHHPSKLRTRNLV